MPLSHFVGKASILLLSGTRNLSHVTAVPNGTPLPAVFYKHNHGFLKVVFIHENLLLFFFFCNITIFQVSAGLMFSILLGSTLAKIGAAALEENEIFVHFDDDEED